MQMQAVTIRQFKNRLLVAAQISERSVFRIETRPKTFLDSGEAVIFTNQMKTAGVAQDQDT